MKKISIVRYNITYLAKEDENSYESRKDAYCHIGGDFSNLVEKILCNRMNSAFDWNGGDEIQVSNIEKVSEEKGIITLTAKEKDEIHEVSIVVEITSIKTFGTED